MKKLFIITMALTIGGLITGCGKDEKSPGSEEGITPSTENDVEITSISVPATLSLDSDWTDGVILPVTLSPSEASIENVNAKVDDESVIDVERQQVGFLITPKKIGTAKVTFAPSFGPASAQTCKVSVTEPGVSEAVSINTIKAEKTSVELSDLTANGEGEEILIPVTLTPSNATYSDLSCSSNDNGVTATLYPGSEGSCYVKIAVESNPTHAQTNVRTAKVTLHAKKGGASDAVISVGVRGHATSFSLGIKNISSENVEDGEIHISKGETVDLKPRFESTGTMKSDVKISYNLPDDLTVDSNILSVSNSFTPTTYKSSITLKASFQSFSDEVKVHTYSAPTGMKFDDHLSVSGHFKAGTANYILSITALPETARQGAAQWYYKGSNLKNISVTRTNTVLKLEFNAATSTEDSDRIEFTQNSVKYNWDFYVDDFVASDPKVGDYVYRTSSGGLRVSDGGLRALNSAWFRQESVNPDTKSGETLLGVIFDPSIDYDSDIPSTMKTAVGGKHLAAVAIKDIPSGSNSLLSRWGAAENQFGSWNTSSYGNKPAYTENSSTYKIYLGEKAMGSKLYFNSALEGFSSTLPLPTKGTTPWMLPCYVDGQTMKTFAGIVQNSLGRYSSSSKLYQSYWTSSYANTIEAYSMTWSGTNCTLKSANKYNYSYRLRPVFAF